MGLRFLKRVWADLDAQRVFQGFLALVRRLRKRLGAEVSSPHGAKRNGERYAEGPVA